MRAQGNGSKSRPARRSKQTAHTRGNGSQQRAADESERTGAATLDRGIAVIGMQGRFPGARNVSEFWENLKAGLETIETFSNAELRAAGIDPALLEMGYVNRGCILEAIDQFDAGFFGYSARDAETIDPQQRVFLECAWESLELAGYNPDTYPGMIGVFAGSDQSSYLYQIYANVDMSAYGYGGMMAIGNEKDYLTTQVSYKLNLRGPSMAVQTSCSTSLVAVCVACQNLRHGYCDIALAGGVAIGIPQKKGYWYQAGGIVSPDGHCRPFDANGQGTVVGNGAGVVVLKRLPDALRDGDNVLAVIKGFALNNDGAGKVGYTAPGIAGQARAIRLAQQMAGVEPDQVGYIEAHGTATALGDPVEIAGLTKAFRERTQKNQFCAVGAVKSNVGHLSSAAGIAGLIKGVLTIQHGQIPPVVHFSKPNTQLNLEKTPFFIASELMDWPIAAHPRTAGVSSFGVGGTNAHIVLQEAPAPPAMSAGREHQILILSARTPSALESMTDNLLAHLDQSPELNLADVAFTLQVGRRVFAHRRAIVFQRDRREELLQALRTRAADSVATTYSESSSRPIVFMFSGQGTQYVGMGASLYASEPVFREHLDHCAAVLKGEIGFDLRDVLHAQSDIEHAAERLKQTDVTQPALFAIEYALARMWMSWGALPKAMMGHSIGEYVAACISGVMQLEDALSIVAMRGRLMAAMPEGSMLVVPLAETSLQPLLDTEVCLAAVNAPSMAVLSGPTKRIAPIEKELLAQGLTCRTLQTSHAFHSSMMDPVLAQFTARLKRVPLQAPQIPYLSNVTGGWITPQLATDPEYWAHHLRGTVRFSDNVREAMTFSDLALLEIGPGNTLGMLARQHGSRSTLQVIASSLPGPQEHSRVTDSLFVARTLGELWLNGVHLNWRAYYGNDYRRRVPLPTYPFERQRYWVGSLDELLLDDSGEAQSEDAAIRGKAIAPSSSPAPGTERTPPKNIEGWCYVPVWKRSQSEVRAERSGSYKFLVLSNNGALEAELLEKLHSLKVPVSVACQGVSYVSSDTGYRLRAANPSDYLALVMDLKHRGVYPTHILHLWSMDAPTESADPAQAFASAQERGFQSLVYLARALSKADAAAPLQIGVVTESLQSVRDESVRRDNEATILSACKGISQEFPNLRCRSIDVVDCTAASLIREMLHEPFKPVVAYRGGERWYETYERIALPQEGRSSKLKPDDVYLITGGLGHIALIIAEMIAAQGPARFALVARSYFPPREEWQSYAANHPQDATTARIQKLLALEEAGSRILVLRADVAAPEQMRSEIQKVLNQWGAIHAVIHAAGNLAADAFAPLSSFTPSQAEAQFRPKVHGLLVLEDLLKEQPIHLWLLVSSLSAVLGGLNLACYAAANVYLDAAARMRNQQKHARWVSVNWDAWTFTGQDPKAISPEQGQACLRRILESDLRHVIVSVTPLAERLSRWVEMASPAATHRAHSIDGVPVTQGAALPVHSEASHARPALSTAFVGARSATEKTVSEVWEHLLGVSPIGIHDKFFELGGHSLLAVQLLSRLREIFAIDLAVQQIFETPTVAQLAASIDERLEKDRVEDASEPELDEMVKLLEGMSDSEVEALLRQASATGGGSSAHV